MRDLREAAQLARGREARVNVRIIYIYIYIYIYETHLYIKYISVVVNDNILYSAM